MFALDAGVTVHPEKRSEAATILTGVFDAEEHSRMTANPYAKQTWRAQAECRGTDPNAFVPEGRGNGLTLYAEARQICDRCPVKTECLQHAITNGEDMGMWGGLTPNERREIGVVLTTLCKKCGCRFRRIANKNQYCDDCRSHRVRTDPSRP